jgi:CRISP-associated protein Cas1
VAGKIRNQRTLLQRNHIEPERNTLIGLKEMAERAEEAGSLAELLGFEGNVARLYFGGFAGMIKAEEGKAPPDLRFDFEGRNRRPPRDPVNALLLLAYSLLAKHLTVAYYEDLGVLFGAALYGSPRARGTFQSVRFEINP